MASSDKQILTAVKTWGNATFQKKGNYLTEIPMATDSAIGGVMPDGETLSVDENGVLSVVGGTGGGSGSNVPIATTETAGKVKPDGTTITVDEDGTIHSSASGTKGDPGDSAYDIATKNGFTGTEKQWLASLKGGDGITPTIGANGNWFIGTTDTGVKAAGKDGKSIQSITTSGNNHIIVTFTDGTTQDIGELSVDVQADFLTETGFGNLRYYNGKFQKYQNGAWVDTAATPENVLVVNMMPNPMQRIVGIFDHNIGHYKLKWLEPEDTVVDGQVICVVDKVVIRRKQNSVPQNENDGDLVIEIAKADFGNHNSEWYVDESLSPAMGDTYYYKAFTVSATGFTNAATVNETGALMAKDHFLFSFTINQETESNPAKMVSYAGDNAKFASAFMDYAADKFNYGDWESAWFIKDIKPCMLKYDGTVDYELDRTDYSKKLDGTDSDITNTTYEGNAMVGIPTVWYKVIEDGDIVKFYIANKQVDDSYHAYAHTDENGNIMPYTYMPIYNGSVVSGKLRSISGLSCMNYQSGTQEITYALANNLEGSNIWNTEVFSDRQLINILLLLIGKSTDSQTIFGNGHCTGGTSASDLLKTGTMNTKGLFWGTNGTGSGVKVFGIENWWGNVFRRLAGYINDRGVQKVKLTYGINDGSTVVGYNTDGNGYIEIENSTPVGTNGGYTNRMLFGEYGMTPKQSVGSSSTFYTDGFWFDDGQNNNYAFVGSDCYFGALAGAFCVYVSRCMVSYAEWDVGAAVSCKPLV